MSKCQECKGTGALVPGDIPKHAVECPYCEGTGKEKEDGKTSC